ncbi:MAG: hypothetical protein HZB67_02090 [Candidatus Aenigmarchaeota archaeon]|nr:hypothetical protein [Candidatus Aenigmarchaeota archaeon]
MSSTKIKMQKDFLIGYFEKNEDFTNLHDDISTPYGRLVAAETANGKRTIVPGFYSCNLPEAEGYRRIGVEPVPEEVQQDIGDMLRKLGYEGQIEFW